MPDVKTTKVMIYRTDPSTHLSVPTYLMCMRSGAMDQILMPGSDKNDAVLDVQRSNPLMYTMHSSMQPSEL